MSSNYVDVKIPKGLAEVIDGIITNNKDHGYRSRAEFVVEAIRAHLRNIGYLKL